MSIPYLATGLVRQEPDLGVAKENSTDIENLLQTELF